MGSEVVTMSRLQTENSSVSTDRHMQSLREVHERLCAFINAQNGMSKCTLSLADSIVDFYSPEVSESTALFLYVHDE